MNCQQVQAELTLYLYGELAPETEEAVEHHAAGCDDCRRALGREKTLFAAMDQSLAEPPPGLLASCRRNLMESVESAESARTGWRGRIRALFSWQAAWVKPAGALALAAVGFFGGRTWQDKSPREQTPVVATRVKTVEQDPAGGIQIVLEETRQRTVSGPMADGSIRRFLLEAAQDPADPGLRVESVDLLRRDNAAGEVRRALMAAMVSDPNPGVRLKALEGLRSYAGDAEVRRSLAQVLLRDENPGVRTQAVDLLVLHKNRDVVDVFQQLMQRESNDYIRSRTQRALREMNASVDSF